MATKTEPALKRAQHYISFEPSMEVKHEEIYLYFETEWRGEACLVETCIDRSRGTDSLNAWRIYVHRVSGGTINEQTLGVSFTDTAKARLSEACKPLCEAWMADPPTYQESRRRAMFMAIKHTLYELRANEYASRDAKVALHKHEDVLSPAQQEHLTALINAVDTFTTLYEKKVD